MSASERKEAELKKAATLSKQLSFAPPSNQDESVARDPRDMIDVESNEAPDKQWY